MQGEAMEAARRSVSILLSQYKTGTVSYLNVITAQAALLSLERGAGDFKGRRLTASVQLIRALGGGFVFPVAKDDATRTEQAAARGPRPGHARRRLLGKAALGQLIDLAHASRFPWTAVISGAVRHALPAEVSQSTLAAFNLGGRPSHRRPGRGQ